MLNWWLTQMPICCGSTAHGHRLNSVPCWINGVLIPRAAPRPVSSPSAFPKAAFMLPILGLTTKFKYYGGRGGACIKYTGGRRSVEIFTRCSSTAEGESNARLVANRVQHSPSHFGSGLLQLPFAPNSLEMAAATQFSVQGALQKWLSNYIKVQSVVASVEEAVLTVTVSYSLLDTGVSQVQTFVYGGNP